MCFWAGGGRGGIVWLCKHRCPSHKKIEGPGLDGVYSMYHGHLFTRKATYVRKTDKLGCLRPPACGLHCGRCLFGCGGALCTVVRFCFWVAAKVLGTTPRFRHTHAFGGGCFGQHLGERPSFAGASPGTFGPAWPPRLVSRELED